MINKTGIYFVLFVTAEGNDVDWLRMFVWVDIYGLKKFFLAVLNNFLFGSFVQILSN